MQNLILQVRTNLRNRNDIEALSIVEKVFTRPEDKLLSKNDKTIEIINMFAGL